jgi:RNA polymerase sigma-70 factor, ECF subfamily
VTAADSSIWTRFSPLVFDILRRMVGPGPHNEDLAQDTFLTVFNRVHTLRNPAALGAFIATVARFTAQGERRKRLLSRQLIGELGQVSHDLVVTTDVEGRQGLLRLAALLARLRSEERSAFALRFIEGKTLDEIASALGLSLPTVKRRLARARNRVALLAARDPILRSYVTPA